MEVIGFATNVLNIVNVAITLFGVSELESVREFATMFPEYGPFVGALNVTEQDSDPVEPEVTHEDNDTELLKLAGLTDQIALLFVVKVTVFDPSDSTEFGLIDIAGVAVA